METSLKSQETDLNSQRKKASTMFYSKTERAIYNDIRLVIPSGSGFLTIPNAPIENFLPRTPESRLAAPVLKSDCMSTDCLVIEDTEDMAPVVGLEAEGMGNFESNLEGVYGLGSGQRDLDELRRFKLNKKCEWGRAAGMPIVVVPGYFAKLGPLPLASHLISVIEGECRPIDPDPIKWDRLINVIRHNAELLRRKGQKPKLVDAGQLTLQLERS